MAENRTTAAPRTDLSTDDITWFDIDITGVRDNSVGLILGDDQRDPTLVVDTADGDRRFLDLSDVQVDTDSADDGLRVGDTVEVVQVGEFDELYVSGIQRKSIAVDYWGEKPENPRLLVHTTGAEEPSDVITLPKANTLGATPDATHGGGD